MNDPKILRGSPDPVDAAMGTRLRLLRRVRNISQHDLGQSIGITFQQIQKYESGRNRLSISMLFRIARRLGVAPATLLPDDPAAADAEPRDAAEFLQGVTEQRAHLH